MVLSRSCTLRSSPACASASAFARTSARPAAMPFWTSSVSSRSRSSRACFCLRRSASAACAVASLALRDQIRSPATVQFPVRFAFILDLLPRTGRLLVGDGAAFVTSCCCTCSRTARAISCCCFCAASSSWAARCSLACCCAATDFFSCGEPVGLRLKLLFVLRTGCSDQRCGKRLGECDRFAAMRDRRAKDQ